MKSLINFSLFGGESKLLFVYLIVCLPFINLILLIVVKSCFYIVSSNRHKTIMPGICHRCEKTVYFNEERMAIGKSFHKTCFVCANKGCGRRLDSGNLTEHSGDVYCRSCYGKLFGPKGYGYGVGAGVLATDATTITTKVVNEPSIKKIGETVVVKPSLSVSSSISSSASPSPVNSVSSTPSPQPPSPTEASSGSTPVSSGTCSPTSDEAISLESDKRESPSPSESISSSSTTANVTPTAAPITTISTPNSISAEINNKGSVAKMINNNNSINSIANGIAAKLKFGGAEMCPRCNKAVYMAERMMGGGSAWHKTSCFNCKECHKRLESTTLCEKDHEIYCKTCYRKNWGPKGYGYGVTALQSCK